LYVYQNILLPYIQNSLSIFHGFFDHHSLQFYDLIFPSTIFVESVSSYINLEGRFRITTKILDTIGSSYTDLEILWLYDTFHIEPSILIFQ